MLNKKSEKEFIITPFAVWLSVAFPIINNFIVVNSGSNYIYYFISIILILGSVINIILKKNKSTFVLKYLKKYIISIFLIIVFNLITVFTSNNIYFHRYLTKYILVLSFIFYLINDTGMIFKLEKEKKNYKKFRYYIPVITYIIINVIGIILQKNNNSLYNQYVLGEYLDLSYGNRFGGIRYSGMFCWPNLFAYSTAAIYFFSYFIPSTNLIRLILMILIFTSKVRTVIIAIFIVEGIGILYKNKKNIYKNIRKIISLILIGGITSIYYLGNFWSNIAIALSSYNYRMDAITNSLEFYGNQNILTLLFGVGLGRFSFYNIVISSYDSYMYNYLNKLQVVLGTSDTFYTIIGEVGILGIIILIYIFLSLFNSGKRYMKLSIIFLLIVAYSTSSPFSYYGTVIPYSIIFIYNYLNFDKKNK